jgi:hypothetical protein
MAIYSDYLEAKEYRGRNNGSPIQKDVPLEVRVVIDPLAELAKLRIGVLVDFISFLFLSTNKSSGVLGSLSDHPEKSKSL